MSKKIAWGVAAALTALGIAAIVKAKKSSTMSKGFVDYVQGQNTPEAKAYLQEQPKATFDPTKFGYNPDLVLPLPPVTQPAASAPTIEEQAPAPLVVFTPTPAPVQPSPSAPEATQPSPQEQPQPEAAPSIDFSSSPPSGVYEPSDDPVSFLPTPVYSPETAPEYYPPSDNQQSIAGLAGLMR